MQAPEIDTLLEIDLRASRRLQRPVPAVLRVDVVRANDLRLGPRCPGRSLLRHGASSARNSNRPLLSCSETVDARDVQSELACRGMDLLPRRRIHDNAVPLAFCARFALLFAGNAQLV